MTSDHHPPGRLSADDAVAWLERLAKPQAREWLEVRLADGRLALGGDPPALRGRDLWRLLLAEECDKLFNQAWCALDQIRSAEDEESVAMLAMDDFPSAVEQAWALAPDLAGEHLDLLREYKQERYDRFVRENGLGTDREAAERAECLAFWEVNAELMSDLRRNLYRAVRGELRRGA